MLQIISKLVVAMIIAWSVNGQGLANNIQENGQPFFDRQITDDDLLVESFQTEPHLVFPDRLQSGDKVALLSSASRATDSVIKSMKQRLETLGLKVILGNYVYDKYYSFAGSDEQRLEDLHEAFTNKDIKAIFQVRGGWGSNKLLSKLDYQLIKENPKILMGFSDIDSLLLTIYAKTGLVTFHGPMGAFDWPNVTIDYMNRVLFAGELVKFINDDEFRTTVINSGKAQGRLIGGNLAVLQSMLGSEYLFDFNGTSIFDDAILFLEDIDEPSYKIDRMLEQLKQNGILHRIKGFVFGLCIDCAERNGLTLQKVFDDHIKPLGIPAWIGAMFGHQNKMFTLPVGAMVEIDADEGSITMLHPAVK